MHCRLCKKENLELFLKLPDTPLANNYVRDQPKYPLELYECKDCGHVQLGLVVDRSLFRDYSYSSGGFLSPYFKEYADWVVRQYRPKTVLDIGSNDGGFLRHFPDDVKKYAVEPCSDLLEKSKEFIDGWSDNFFTKATADLLHSQVGKVDIITANNVFAHLEDIDDFMDGIDVLLEPNGRFIFEVSHWPDIVENCHFDTVYHEHVDYFSLGPLDRYFNERGFMICNYHWMKEVQGGSVRVMVGRGLRREEAEYAHVQDNSILMRRKEWLVDTIVSEISDHGGIVDIMGVPAKATTMWYSVSEISDVINCGMGLDESPLKIDKYLPGTEIPILRPTIDCAGNHICRLLCAWNYPQLMYKYPGIYLVPTWPEPKWVVT